MSDDEELPGAGHNSGKVVNGVAADRLTSLIARIERMDEERKAISADIKDIYLEAKSAGFNVKVIRAIITLRKADPDTVEEFEMLLDTYKLALGMGQ